MPPKPGFTSRRSRPRRFCRRMPTPLSFQPHRQTRRMLRSRRSRRFCRGLTASGLQAYSLSRCAAWAAGGLFAAFVPQPAPTFRPPQAPASSALHRRSESNAPWPSPSATPSPAQPPLVCCALPFSCPSAPLPRSVPTSWSWCLLTSWPTFAAPTSSGTSSRPSPKPSSSSIPPCGGSAAACAPSASFAATTLP